MILILDVQIDFRAFSLAVAKTCGESSAPKKLIGEIGDKVNPYLEMPSDFVGYAPVAQCGGFKFEACPYFFALCP